MEHILDIPYYQEITIFVFRFTSTAARQGISLGRGRQGRSKPWRETRSRNLCLKQRIRYLHMFLLSKIRHSTDFPDPEGTGAATRNGNVHVWCGAIFRVPLSTLQRRTDDGGMELIDFVAICRVHFPIRFRTQGDRSVSLTAEQFNVRTSLAPRANPPHIRAIPRTLEYLRIYLHEWEYMKPRRQAETGWASKPRVSNTLRTMSTAVMKARELYIMQHQPAIYWTLVLGNLCNVILPVGVRRTWCVVIHDIAPRNVRLHRIRLSRTDKCTSPGRKDTMLHSLSFCVMK